MASSSRRLPFLLPASTSVRWLYEMPNWELASAIVISCSVTAALNAALRSNGDIGIGAPGAEGYL